MKKYLDHIGKKSKKAVLKSVNTKKKNKVLLDFAILIKKNEKNIIKQNKKDISFAIKKGLKKNMIERLILDKIKIKQIENSIKKIVNLKDPVDKIIEKWKRPNGLRFKKVTIPIGVIGIIYESRPNVTSDVSCLCFKSGNAVILKGGSEAFNSNKTLVNLFKKALIKNNIDPNYVQLIEKRNRQVVNYMLTKMKEYIDVIIPRGGKGLVKEVQKKSAVPFIGHLEGICHTYVDKSANMNMAKKIILNAKLRNTAICGATETVLFHEKIVKKFTNPILNHLNNEGCEIYADNKIKKIYDGKVKLASKKDWSKEYLSPKLSVKVVKNINEAIDHINYYGTMHTDAIVTSNRSDANYFLKNVKSAIAIHNSSTQFADGGEFGFGGEVGISTNKTPPRGPVGLNQLVSYKYEVYGSGQIRK